jgi:Arc/MetJ family transcription regulator
MQTCRTDTDEVRISTDTGSAEAPKSDVRGGTLTTVSVDSELLEKACAATGINNDRELVELALRTVIQLQAERELLKMQGTVEWEGDLDEMRADK